MPRPKPSKARSVAFGCAFLLCAGAVTAWKYLQPGIQTASKAEIRAVLPPDMLQADKTDVQGLVRLTRLTAIARRLIGSEYGRITGPMLALKQRGKVAEELWRQDKESIDTLKGLLRDGPLQCPPTTDVWANNGELDSIKSFARCLAFFAMATASVGDFSTAADAIEMDLELSQRMARAGGGIVPYLVTVAVTSATDNAIQQIARTPGCPVELCRQWLDRLPAVSGTDTMLQAAIREDFQARILPLLSEPTQTMRDLMRNGYYMGGFYRSEPTPEEYEGLGSYDPIGTAKSLAQVIELRLANAGRPFSKYDIQPDQIVTRQAAGLPDFIGRRRSFERVRFRLIMNTQPNSIGRSMVLLYTMFGSRGSVELSCRWRTMNECTQVLLATILYRSDHGGQMPATLSGLAPKYLPATPNDLFTGKPLSYDPAREIVWSVGPDLRDDGGQIYGFQRQPRDVGLYLGPVDERSQNTDMSGAYDNQVRGTSAEVRRIDTILR